MLANRQKLKRIHPNVLHGENPLVTFTKSWCCHQMETFSALLALCEGNSPVTGGFPSQRTVIRSFDIFYDLRLNKRLSKQSKRLWFETLSRSLWRRCNVIFQSNSYLSHNVTRFTGANSTPAAPSIHRTHIMSVKLNSTKVVWRSHQHDDSHHTTQVWSPEWWSPGEIISHLDDAIVSQQCD